MSWSERMAKFFVDHPEAKALATCNSPYASRTERYRGNQTALNQYPEYRALMKEREEQRAKIILSFLSPNPPKG